MTPHRTLPASLLAALAAVLLVTGVVVAASRSGGGGGVGGGDGAGTGVAARLQAIAHQVADVRGLDWRRTPPIRVLTPDALAHRVRQLDTEDLRPDRLAGDGATYRILGLVPADVDYLRLLDDLMAEQVKGFYDSQTKELVISDDGEGRIDAATALAAAHEFAHALTDQHFAFGPRADALDEADRQEELAALSAVVEGDAVLTERLWGSRHLSIGDQVSTLFSGAPSTSVLDRTPRFVQDLLLFPYQGGYEFVRARHRGGGWPAVNALYRNPPTSTEQVLHPERYARGEGWEEPPLADLAATTGCSRLRRATFGEFQLAGILQRELISREAAAAATGWNGDVFEAVRCGTATGLVARFSADAEGDGARLAAAFFRWARERAHALVLRSGARVDLVVADDRSTAERLRAAAG